MDDPPRKRSAEQSDHSAAAACREAFARRASLEELLHDAIERTADRLPEFEPLSYREILEALDALSIALGRLSIISLILDLRRQSSRSQWRRQAERLLREENADAASALELKDAIERALEVGRIEDVGALAYLMRGVVENRRRHLAWAMEVLASDDGLVNISSEALREKLAPYETVTDALRILRPKR